MKKIFSKLRGDKGIWSFVALLALFSFMPVFSASSNLAYMNHGTGNTLSYLAKHFVHVFLGFVIMFYIQKVPYHYFKNLCTILLPISWVCLLIAMFFGVEEGSAARWVRVPVVGVTFQPSAIAFIVLMMYVARYLSIPKKDDETFWGSFFKLWGPVAVTLILILPNNFSTAALIFVMVLMLTFVGNYPLRNIFLVVGMGLGFAFCFWGAAKLAERNDPDNIPKVFRRVKTWEGRIMNYSKNEVDSTDEDYQIEKAKTAIASGGLYGVGPGKSVQKNFLPQSSSDFIFAIIIEEYGFIIGGLGVIFLYLLLFMRFMVAAHKASTPFGKYLVAGLGFPIIFQALINMGVATQLLPVTGQTLPLISSGGSSIWMTCISIGIIISVTKREEELEQEAAEKEQREIALQKLIDKQLEEDARMANDMAQDTERENYSIKESGANPMDAVRNK